MKFELAVLLLTILRIYLEGRGGPDTKVGPQKWSSLRRKSWVMFSPRRTSSARKKLMRGTALLEAFPVTHLPRISISKGVFEPHQAGVDIDARNSVLDFVFVSRLSNNSIASTVESGLSTFRRTHTRLSSSAGSNNSSLRVPDR